MRYALLLLALLAPFALRSALCDEGDKPKAAVFPLAGDADAGLRKRCGFALRTKLSRDGTYDVIDGYAMADLVADADPPVGFQTPADQVKALAKGVDATVLIWGEIAGAGDVRLKILDLREKDAQPRTVEKTIAQPTDMRFVTEAILQTLPGVKAFEHPNETAVVNDPLSLELWARNPNLVVDGDFTEAGHWDGIYESEKYPVEISDEPPAVDKVDIYRLSAKGDEKARNVLAMRLSKDDAENNGLACLSDAIAIQPATRYRISFRYKSDGPILHVFVKGYTMAPNIEHKMVPREVYRRQVPPSGGTGGKWATVVCDLNPQNVGFPVQELRIDLYAYLHPGLVMFDDVILKAVGAQTDVAKDDAIKPPVSRPSGSD